MTLRRRIRLSVADLSRSRLLVAVPALLGTYASGAIAQEAASALQEVVVTATRRAESMQDVPIAVSAISGDAIAKSGVAEIRDLLQVVPGLYFVQANQSAQPVIRGITSTNPGVADEPNVAIYVDGIYQPDSQANNFDLLRTERVEVLRGPQGTLFGRNATGGLINYITPDPSFDTSGDIALRYGRFNARQMRGYLTTGLTDQFAWDLNASYYEDDGYGRNILLDKDAGERRSRSARTKLMYRPSEEAKVVLALGYNNVKDYGAMLSQPFKDNTIARQYPAVIRPNPDKPYQTAVPVDEYIHPRALSAALQTQFELGAVNLETATSYQHVKGFQPADYDGTAAGTALPGAARGQFIQNRTRADYFSNEIRLLSNSTGAPTGLPASTASGRRWISACPFTRAHPRTRGSP